MKELIFKEETHEYYIDGIVKPSVTQILGAMKLFDYSMIDKWYAERGTAVHLACELYDNKTLDESSIDDVIAPYLAAYKKFLLEACPEWNLIESRLYDEIYDYCGTIDRVGRIFNSDCIIDIKTQNTGPWAAIQTAAYNNLVMQSTNIFYKRYILELHEDETYKLIEYNNRNDFKVFLSALTIYNWKQKLI